jgi:uncharacterized protein YceH (UPF0502 family)
MHLFSGEAPPAETALAAEQAAPVPSAAGTSALAARVDSLEAAVAALRVEVDALRARLESGGSS